MNQIVRTIILSIILIPLSLQGDVYAGMDEDVEKLGQTIQHLLDHVSNSQLTFIRNGTEYTGVEAAEHMENKYAYFKKKIKTAEDFIELTASKSLMSGKPYMIVTEHGERIRSDSWLLGVLLDYRKHHHAGRLR